MYNPASFAVTDESQLLQFIAEYPFGQLITCEDGIPTVSHIPMQILSTASGEKRIIGHLAKANPHWRLADQACALAVFTGPHAYISSSWYETPQSVPTWNYTAVHVSGRMTLVTARNRLVEIIEQLVTAMEKKQSAPWKLKQAGEEFIDQLLASIVGFEIEIDTIEGKFKLSQNHSHARQQRVIDALTQQSDQQAQQVARLMSENLAR